MSDQAPSPDPGPAAQIRCDDHHWVATHQPDFPVYWIVQCSVCGYYDPDFAAGVIAERDAAVAALATIVGLGDCAYAISTDNLCDCPRNAIHPDRGAVREPVMTDHTPAGRIRTALYSIRDNFDDTLQPARRGAGSHVLGAMVDPPLPVAADILDKRAKAHERLAYWARLVITARHLHLLAAADPPALATFLLIHVDWLAGYPKALTELEGSAADLRVITADNAPRHQDVGRCPGTTNGTPCPGMVKATIRRDDDLLPSELTCTGTPSHSWPAGEWRVLERRLHMDAGAARRLAAAIRG